MKKLGAKKLTQVCMNPHPCPTLPCTPSTVKLMLFKNKSKTVVSHISQNSMSPKMLEMHLILWVLL